MVPAASKCTGGLHAPAEFPIFSRRDLCQFFRMASETLTARVARLEKTVSELVRKKAAAPKQDLFEMLENGPREPGRDEWKSVVGMFDGDEMMKRIDERGAALRRAERRKARRA